MANSRKQKPVIKNIVTKKAVWIPINNGNQFPNELIIEILSRLPVQALLQFKTVCKLWNDTIKSSYFVSTHLRNYYYYNNNNNCRDRLIVQYSKTPAGALRGYELGAVRGYELMIDNTKKKVLSYKRIKPPASRVYNSFLCGPCDGIYFVSSFRSRSRCPTKRSLWNPALNELKILPDMTYWKPELPRNSDYIAESAGFGYDAKTDDYKVILIWGYHRDSEDVNFELTDNPMSIVIYSLKTNSWRHWGDLDNVYHVLPSGNYVCVNGCYYWHAFRIVTPSWEEFILSFDLSAETCEEIPLPKLESNLKHSQLMVYQDSIAFVSVPDDNTGFNVHTWNNAVWTQKLSMKLGFGVVGAFSQWRDNMLVFRQLDGKLVLLDTNTKHIFILNDPQAGECDMICDYRESLVSIKDSNHPCFVSDDLLI